MSILLRRFADSKPDLAHGTLSRSTAAPAASTVSRAPFAESGGLAGMARQVAREHGLDPALLAGVASVESGWNPRAESPAGAKGLMQLMDGTARQLGVTDPFDPAQSLRGGAQYLRDLLNRYGGDQRLALAAYNAGPGSVDRFGGIPPYPETQHYVAAVLDAAAEIRSQG
jgi:soluble lytic murein transglycosylase-like protein